MLLKTIQKNIQILFICKISGDVKKQKWTNGSEEVTRSYAMTYDNLGRLTKALYGEDGTNNNAFTELMTYNANGAVTKAVRYSRGEGNNSGDYDTKEIRSITLDGNQPSSTLTTSAYAGNSKTTAAKRMQMEKSQSKQTAQSTIV